MPIIIFIAFLSRLGARFSAYGSGTVFTEDFKVNALLYMISIYVSHLVPRTCFPLFCYYVRRTITYTMLSDLCLHILTAMLFSAHSLTDLD